MKKSYLVVGIIIVLLVVVFWIFDFSGNKAEEISDSWKSDDIQLMQHVVDGYFGCFGCSKAGDEPALCIDPVPEMKQVEEIEGVHCNSNFEVVG